MEEDCVYRLDPAAAETLTEQLTENLRRVRRHGRVRRARCPCAVLWWGGLVGGKRIIIMVNTSDRPVSVPSILCQVPLTLGRYEVKIIRE